MLLVWVTVLFFSGTDGYFEDMVRVRRHLHQHPELSNREFKTQAYLKEELRRAGFKDIRSLAITGLKVVYDTGKPGRVLAFRADVDALPVTEETDIPFASKNVGIMHACGHDIHTGILFGTALAIKNDPSLSGKFVFLFQPAEEGPPPGEEGGASLMIADGALRDPVPEVIFGLHGMGNLELGTIGVRAGGIMARADRFHIQIKGKQTHASTPHLGIDPIFVAGEVVANAQAIVSRRIDSRTSVVLSFGEFNAGQRFNIIPQTARLTGTIRSLDVEVGDLIPQLLDQVIAGISSAHGAGYVFENETMCPSTQNHPEWTRKASLALVDGGFNLIDVQPVMAAEDFAYYAKQIPGVYFFLGVCATQNCANIHSPSYAPAEEAMKTGAAMFMRLALSFSAKQAAANH